MAVLACLSGVVLAGSAEFDPSAVDIVSLVECEADAPTYNGFALWLTETPGNPGRLGWQEVATDNPFLREFRLPAPVSAFGHEAGSIVFSSSGPMVVLDDVAPQELAGALGITPVISAPDKFMGEKVIVETSEEDAGVTFKTRIALNVSTVMSHPGKTLAGCSYSVEVQ